MLLFGPIVPSWGEPVLDELVTRCRFGAYADNEPYPVEPHFALESALGGTKLPVCSWFLAFGQPWPASEAAKIEARGGYDVLLAWEFHGIDFEDVLASKYDEHIWDFVNAAAQYSRDVVLRPFHESNGDWYDWAPASGRGFCTGADQWKAAWRHVVSVARRASKDNIKFLWCMNNTDADGIDLESLWPGGDYVDLVGCDAYSWTADGTLDAILGVAYARITALDSAADFWIGEMGLADQQDDPAAFYRSVYGSRDFPRLSTVSWFSKSEFALTVDGGALAVHREQLPRALQN